MNGTLARKATVAIAIAVLGFGLAGCAGSTPSNAPDDKTASDAPTKTAPTTKPTDLTGEWVQSNSKSADSYQAATITGDSIEINWISDGGDTTSLYWAGSYVAPTADGSFSWESANDTSKTSSAMLASSDPTKTFDFVDDIISYQVSLLGTTTKVELKRE